MAVVKTSVKSENEITTNITLEIPRELLNERVKAKLGVVAGRAQMKGFRKGRVPKDFVGKLYGDELKFDVLNDLISENYRVVAEDNKLNIVGQPDIDLDEKEIKSGSSDITITVKVSLYPNPKISKYKGLKIKIEEEKITDEDVENSLKGLQEQFATTKDVEGRDIVQLGDTVVIDYVGLIDAKQFDDLIGNAVAVELAEGRAPEHLVTGLVGMKVGEEKEIPLDVPADVKDKKVAGKTIIYQVKINAIQEKVLAELDDELAKKSGKAENIADLRKVLHEEAETQVADRNKNLRIEKTLEEVVKQNPFLVPQNLIDQEIRGMLMEWGVFKREDKEAWRRDVSMFRDKLGEQAEQKVKNLVVIEKVKELEGITATDEEVEQWFDEQSKKYKLEIATMKQYYGVREGEKNDMVKKIVENEKVMELLTLN